MNQADVTKLMSKLRVALNPRRRKLRNSQGPMGRLTNLQKTVTGLIEFERIELNYPRADEARQYAERLISDAIRHGDCHKPTMDMATQWIKEPRLVHKLFKVLVPRFAESQTSYTRMYKAPREYPGVYPQNYSHRAVLELRGNPFPPLGPQQNNRKNLLHNFLLEEAKKAKVREQVESLEAKVAAAQEKTPE